MLGRDEIKVSNDGKTFALLAIAITLVLIALIAAFLSLVPME